MACTKQFETKATDSLDDPPSDPGIPASHNDVDFIGILSEELLDRIALALDFPGDLRALSMTCRRFHRIVLPHFFAHVDFRPESRLVKPSADGRDSYGSHSRDTAAKFRPFAVLMLQRSDLARLVRSFCMRPGFDSNDEFEVTEDPQNPPTWVELDPVLENAVQQHAHSEEEKRIWVKALKRQNYDVEELNDDPVLALLLPCLPNLERLALQLPQHAPYIERMMDRCATRTRPFDTNRAAFSQLQNVGSIYWEDHYGMKPYWFARCLRLPNIRRIFMYFVGTGSGYMNLVEEDEHLARLPSQSSSCEHIELRNAKLSDHDMEKTLEACRALKTLIYELGWGYLSWCSPNMGKLMDSLSPHKDSLENIFLDLKHYGATEDDGILFAPISLSNFTHLKHIKINPVFLTGRRDKENFTGETARRTDLAKTLPELFPPSLERLCITNAQNSFQDIVTGLQKLLLRKYATHPALRELILEGPWGTRTDYWADLVELLPAAQAANVVFVTKANRYPGTNDGFSVAKTRRWGMDGEFCWVELGSEFEPFEIVDIGQRFHELRSA